MGILEMRLLEEAARKSVILQGLLRLVGRVRGLLSRGGSGSSSSSGESTTSLLSRGLGSLFGDLSVSGVKETTTITVEHGFVKLMVSEGPEILDYRISIVDPRFFREGIVSDPVQMSRVLLDTLEDMGGQHRRVIGAVPGYQSNLGQLDLPRTKDMNPGMLIPREARRTMGVSPETSYLLWRRLPDNVDQSQWLVLSAAWRSITSMVDTVRVSGLSLSTLELRPFALARAVNQADAIIVWTAADGVDVVIVKDSAPVAHQSAYWGSEPVEGAVLVDRLSTIVERTISDYDQRNAVLPISEWVPIYVSGSPAAVESSIDAQVASNLRRSVGQPRPAMMIPSDFPIHDLIVNVGLALWEA